jgi:pyruvate dehydrogenase E2 component (dihydrolipoamide acetyltransferase)
MPSLGADMKAGTVLEWRVAPGDHVHRGDIVATVDTSKAEIDIEIFDDGVIDELIVKPGEKVPVGTVLATIRSDAITQASEAPPPAGGAPELPPSAAPSPPAAPPEAPAPPAGSPPAAPPEAPAPPAAAALASAIPEPPPPAAPPPRVRARAAPPVPARGAGRVLASPYARRLGAERGVELGGVAGSGPRGAVLAADVPAGAPAGPDHTASMRDAIAAAMARSNREIPHYYLQTSIDMTAALAWLAEHNAALPVRERLLPAVLMLKAAALAAREVPALNGYWIDGAARPSAAVHVGVAIALRSGGLIAPAIHDADAKPLDELMRVLRDLVHRVRTGGLRSSELTDATITVTSLGDRGARTVFGVIYPPQVGLVGFGAIVERPWASDGMLGVRPVVDATLAADHRASDGHQGSALLAAIDHHLHEPETL